MKRKQILMVGVLIIITTVLLNLCSPREVMPSGDKPVLLFLGDSFTDGYTLGKEEAYPRHIQDYLDHAGYGVDVVNGGRSGDTARDGARRLSQFLDLPIVLFLVAFGANDDAHGVPPNELESHLSQILSEVRTHHPQAKLLVAPGIASVQYAPAYQRVASQFHATLVGDIRAQAATDRSLLLPDRFHPNAAGHRHMADTLMPFILSALRDLVPRSKASATPEP